LVRPPVRGIDLIAMTVPLVDDGLASVQLECPRPRDEVTRLRTEAHGAAEITHVPLLREQVDDRMRRVGVELARVRVLQAALVASELDDGTRSEERRVGKECRSRWNREN